MCLLNTIFVISSLVLLVILGLMIKHLTFTKAQRKSRTHFSKEKRRKGGLYSNILDRYPVVLLLPLSSIIPSAASWIWASKIIMSKWQDLGFFIASRTCCRNFCCLWAHSNWQHTQIFIALQIKRDLQSVSFFLVGSAMFSNFILTQTTQSLETH